MVVVSFITAGKFIFIEHTEMGWGIDLFFKSYKTRKSINMLASADKKNIFFYEQLLVAASYRKTPVFGVSF